MFQPADRAAGSRRPAEWPRAVMILSVGILLSGCVHLPPELREEFEPAPTPAEDHFRPGPDDTAG